MGLYSKSVFSSATKFTVLFSALVALVIPVGFYIMSYQYMMGIMQASSEINSGIVSRLISDNPELWRYETIRIEELLKRRTSIGGAESRRIFDVDNLLVAESVADMPLPLVTVSHGIIDNGEFVGRIEISRSLLPLLLKSAALAVVGLIVGLILYRWLPFRTVIAVGKQLQDANDFLKKVMEGSANPIAVVDQSGRITMHNGHFQELAGCSREEILEGSIGRMFSGDELPRLESGLHDVLTGAADGMTLEATLSRLDGVAVCLVIRAVPLFKEGHISGVVVSLEDITERRLFEKNLRKKTFDMEQFIYTVSHDLRTPLVTIKTFMGYLEGDMAGSDRERVGQDIQFIHSAADKMKLLLDELLEVSRVDRVDTPHVGVTLVEVLTEVLDAMAGVINERNVVIRWPDTDLKLHVDRQRFCQIWQNLIENAIKYSSEHSPPMVELGIRQDSGETAFFVKDNGIGIAPHYHSRIFGLFDKLDPKSPGAGIGLSMVQRIVEKCGGRVWVESEGGGNGACFFFTLPNAVDQG